MFSAFLTRLRLNPTETNSDDIDDTSSVNRSLNLPWPVTESSARRPTTPNAARKDWTYGQSGSQASGTSGMTISHPIPRTGPNSLTGFDDYMAPSTSGSAYGRQVHAGPSQTAALPEVGYESAEKQGKISSRPQGHTQRSYAPPAVVRLDSGADENNGEYMTNNKDILPPSYAFEQPFNPNASTVALPYPRTAAQQQKTVDLRHDSGLESEFYSSPFDDSDPETFIPVPPLSASSSSLTSTPKPGAMTKSKWGLKLQLHGAQSMPSLPAGAPMPHPLSNPPHVAHSDTAATAQAHPLAGVNIDTDVFKHAYNYPLAKQLSPIAEQDYFSPVVESDSRSLSLRFGKAGFSNASGSAGRPSPAESGLGSMREGVKGKKGKSSDPSAEKESLKTRSGSSRTGSGGSVGTVNGMSRTGSQNASPGETLGDLSRPSPIYASPFITRHPNRTVSQTSSKSDSPPQPNGSQTPTQAQSSPQIPAQIPIHLQGPSRAGATNVSISTAPRSSPSTNSNPNKTPTSATTAATGTATMYSPTSTVQTPTAKTPVSPNVNDAVLVQRPPPAPTTSTTTMVFPLPPQSDPSSYPTPRVPKIPSLPAMAPLDLRFSLLGSVSPRTSREVRISHAGDTSRKTTGPVQKMPVIDGSVEEYYEEEEEEDDDEDDDDFRVVIEGEEYDEEYDRESLHAESFVTAGTNEDGSNKDNHQDLELGVELATLNKGSHRNSPPSSGSVHTPPRSTQPLSRPGTRRSHVHDSGLGDGTAGSMTGESIIQRGWERHAALGFGPACPSPTRLQTKGRKSWLLQFSSSSSLTPAFWAFWLGFVCPFLWLVGGWHFTNAGELPPKLTVWEWYFWKSGWSVGGGLRVVGDKLRGCCAGNRGRRASRGSRVAKEIRGSQDGGVIGKQHARRNGGKRRSTSHSDVRSGKVYPALPRWVADKQSTDDGRMRLNDPKRSLRGISFGYPFISRLQISQDSYNPNPPQQLPSSSLTVRILKGIAEILSKPNRILDMLYGVKLREVRGRPESGRRMFDPWIQRCRYALCYAMALLAVGLFTASTYLIIVSIRNVV